MPSPGLSLVGFMDRNPAITYLRRYSHPGNITEAQAEGQWRIAKGKLGSPIPNAGHPKLQDFDSQYDPYLQRVTQNPRYSTTVKGMPASFRLVEIDPLLAFQFQLDMDRVARVLTGITGTPSMEQMIGICLPENPLDPRTVPMQTSETPTSLTITSTNPNLRVIVGGQFVDPATGQSLYDPNIMALIAGIGFGEGSPLSQVARFDGRCYLKNGYHRAYALRTRGQDYMPCVLVDATDYAEVIEDNKPGQIFDRDLLVSRNPPTIGHFTQGRAYNVTLRPTRRVIQLQWSAGTLPG